MAMKVAVIGSGYVGLVSGVCLAAKGHSVVCVDTNPAVVDRIRAGDPHIYEPGLEELLRRVLDSGTFRAETDTAAALAGVDGAMIAVSTPTTDGQIDLTYIEQAAAAIGAELRRRDGLAVIVKSTVLPGVTDTVVRGILERVSGKPRSAFGLGMNPEFLREGQAVADFLEPDRIVLGHDDECARRFLAELYAPWACETMFVNSRTAELIKYANNALLATQISAINEIANLAQATGGIDAMDVVRGVHLDRRWNPVVDGKHVRPGILSYLIPGCGFGGSCFPKDVQALRAHGRNVATPTPVIDAVLAVNDKQPAQVGRVLRSSVDDLADQTVLVLGLAFKPDTDDVREAPAIKIIRDLAASTRKIVAHDPKATDNFRRALGPVSGAVTYVDDWRPHVKDAGVIVVVTTWPEYSALTGFDLTGKTVLDARRMFKPSDLGESRYLAIGLGGAAPALQRS